MLHQLMQCIENSLGERHSLQDLEKWLVGHLQEILDSGDETAIRIADEIDADLVCLGEGLIDEATFRSRLEGYLKSVAAPSH